MIDMGFEPQMVGVLDVMFSSNLKPQNEDEELDKKNLCQTTYMFGCFTIGQCGVLFFIFLFLFFL